MAFAGKIFKSDRDGCLPDWMDRELFGTKRANGSYRKLSVKHYAGARECAKFTSDGIVSFPKKKKNGCKLSSQAEIAASIEKTVDANFLTCDTAWKPIALRKPWQPKKH